MSAESSWEFIEEFMLMSGAVGAGPDVMLQLRK